MDDRKDNSVDLGKGGNARVQKRSVGGGAYVFDVYSNGQKVESGLPPSSVSGDTRGGVYDVASKTYTGLPDNDELGYRPIRDNGFDSVPRPQIENPAASSGSGGDPSGGIPEGYVEEIFNVVQSDNTIGQRYFLTKTT